MDLIRCYQVMLLLATIIICIIASTQSFTDDDGSPGISLETSEAFWENWSEWSNCSRPCGGGITQRIRHCIKTNNETNAVCVGELVQYRMCNIQDCPDGSADFRAQQCSAYDKTLFKGKSFQWASYIHHAGECELKCMPKKEFFYITFKNKVIDGTACNEFSQDVCVNGTCLPVGCDMQLYSPAILDICGVCRGDNSTCVKKQSTYRVSSQAYDYVDVATIPNGATNILIKELGKTAMYITLRSNDKSIINGDYIFSNAGKRKHGNSVLQYQRTKTLNQVLIDGPTNGPIDVKVFVFGGATNDVYYEYYVPTSYKGEEKRVEYMWIIDAWNECTKSCATGIRTRHAYCVNKETKGRVRAFYCRKDQKPHLKENCNTEPCPARWYISQWAPCSKTCGRGLRTRRVHCVQTVEGGNINMLNHSDCPGEVPKRVESCVVDGTCPDWIVKHWSECSQTCGEGIQRRTVECINLDDNSVEEYKCSIETKPIVQRPCFHAPCGSNWITGDWSECSNDCGEGIRSRYVSCQMKKGIDVPTEFCDKTKEPTHFQPCTSSGPCTPTWKSGEWSQCSARCGRGRQMRTAVCSVINGNQLEVLVDSDCNAANKPELMRRCFSKTPCHVNYLVSNWGECSVTCGIGHQERKVKCYADRRVDYTNEACAKLTKPQKYKRCYASKNCKGEKIISFVTTSVPDTTNDIPAESPANAVKIVGPTLLHQGDNADYRCRVLGYPIPKVTWTLNGEEITSNRFQPVDGENRLVILAVLTEDEGELTCHAKNSLRMSNASITISVSSPPSVVVTPKSKTLQEGDSIVIICEAKGSPLPRIQWIKDTFTFYGDGERIILGPNRIIFKRVEAHDAGEYICAGFNSAGTSSGSMQLTVKRSTVPTIPDGNCLDDNTRANCDIVLRQKICGIPHYKKVCCKTCNSK